jgi:tetratricopeptide (TPR) repeat protein
LKHRTHPLIGLSVLFTCLALTLTGFGQYREYYIYGKVLDTQKGPLEGVEISLRDVATSRSFSMKTKKDGEFKFVGLPHGTYNVVFKKDGFAVKQDEWKFDAPQLSLQKVEIPPVIMASQERIQEVQRLKETEAGVRSAADKLKQGDYDAAVTLLTPILARNPNDPNALYLMGMAYLKKKMWAEALAPFVKVTELSPKFAPAVYEAGVCYQQLNQPEKALECYKKAQELDPANPDSPYNSGLLLFGMSRIEEALALFEKTLALKPDDPAALEMAGRCYIHQANLQKAVDYLERAKAGYTGDQDRVKFLDDLIAKLKEQIKK